VEIQAKTTDDDVTIAERRALDGSRYVFVRTDNHKAPRSGTAQVKENDGTEFSFDYKLEAFGSLVLYLPPGEKDARHGEWLPRPAPEIKRPANLPAPVVINEAQRFADPLPATWTPLANAGLIEALGVYGSHFVYYKIPVRAGTSNATISIEVQPGDGVIGVAGGKILSAVPGEDKKHFVFTLPPEAKELILLHDQHGHRNGPKGMESGGTYGLLSVAGASESAPIEFARGGSLGQEREAGEAFSQADAKPGMDWNLIPIGPNASPNTDALLTWYRMQFGLPPQKSGVWLPWHLHVEASGNGFIYVNGHCLGRYWQAGPQHDFYIPETWLHFGTGKTNAIALDLRPLDKGVCMQAVQIVPDTAFAEFR
jgi:hypothetical protein